MVAKREIETVSDPDDPGRCQALGRDSDQCMKKAIPGSEFCPLHGGNKALEAADKEATMQYRLTRFKVRVREFATDPGVKGLREEIGITRMMLEELLNGKCTDATELLMHSSKISQLIRDIANLVSTAHKLESSMGLLLDKMAAVQLSQEIVTIISDAMSKNIEAVLTYVPPDSHEKVTGILECNLVDQIIEGFGGALERASSKTDA